MVKGIEKIMSGNSGFLSSQNENSIGIEELNLFL